MRRFLDRLNKERVIWSGRGTYGFEWKGVKGSKLQA
jgi:hypothetical protein